MLMVDRYALETGVTVSNEIGLSHASASCQEEVFLSIDFKPSKDDVICSRGSISYHHAANVRLREMIENSLDEYQRAQSKIERSAIVSKIIESVQENRGKFVRQDRRTKRWFQVGSRTTREKVGQSIRAALKKRERYESQCFTKKTQTTKQSLAKTSPLLEESTSMFAADRKYAPHARQMREDTIPTFPAHQIPAASGTSTRSPPIAGRLGGSIVSQIRRDEQTITHDSKLDTILLTGTVDVPAVSGAFSVHHRPRISTTRMMSVPGTTFTQGLHNERSLFHENINGLGLGLPTLNTIPAPLRGYGAYTPAMMEQLPPVASPTIQAGFNLQEVGPCAHEAELPKQRHSDSPLGASAPDRLTSPRGNRAPVLGDEFSHSAIETAPHLRSLAASPSPTLPNTPPSPSLTPDSQRAFSWT